MEELRRSDRVRLVATTDPYTRLRPGALGTVTAVRVELGEMKIWVDWDDGAVLAVLPAAGDQIELMSRGSGR